jgi:hypothetical protein
VDFRIRKVPPRPPKRAGLHRVSSRQIQSRRRLLKGMRPHRQTREPAMATKHQMRRRKSCGRNSASCRAHLEPRRGGHSELRDPCRFYSGWTTPKFQVEKCTKYSILITSPGRAAENKCSESVVLCWQECVWLHALMINKSVIEGYDLYDTNVRRRAHSHWRLC